MNPIVEVARRFLFVREVGGANRGLWVELFLRFTGNAPGDSWCAAFVSFVLYIVYRGKSPIIKSAGCDELLADCRKKGFIVTEEQALPGDLVFSVNGTDAHHVAILTAWPYRAAIMTIAGNTSSDGKSSNGDGVYEHLVGTDSKVYARLPKAA